MLFRSKEERVLSGRRSRQKCLDAGAPMGTYTNVFISGERCATPIGDKRIKGVALNQGLATQKEVDLNCEQ